MGATISSTFATIARTVCDYLLNYCNYCSNCLRLSLLLFESPDAIFAMENGNEKWEMLGPIALIILQLLLELLQLLHRQGSLINMVAYLLAHNSS